LIGCFDFAPSSCFLRDEGFLFPRLFWLCQADEAVLFGQQGRAEMA
jgi:hypothetical protein